MKTAPSRSPSRRPSPPPPRLSHRSPGFRRGRSPERRRRDSQSGGSRLSPPRSRERREFRPSPRSQPPSEFPIPRRSRSPIRESKRRSFSPKRKSPKREREHRDPERERSSRPVSRKRSRSKTPPVAVGSSIREGAPRLGPYSGPSDGPSSSRGYPVPDSYSTVEPVMEVEHSSRSISSIAERFPIASRGSYEDDRGERAVFRGPGSEINFSELNKIAVDVRNDRPVFRGPDGTGYNVNELKKLTVDIHRKIPVSQPRSAERPVINPEDVIVVRRPEISHDGEYTSERSRRVSHDHYDEHRSPSPKRRHHSPWEQEDPNNLNHRRNKSEGSRPIFARDEIIQASERSKYEPGPTHERRSIATDEHQRVVAIFNHPPQTQSSGGPRYESPARYSSSHQPTTYYSDRDRRSSSREYVRSRDYERSRGSGFEPREKSRERFERRDDLRHDLELRRRDDSRYTTYSENVRTYEKGREYRGESDRGSDLRVRIHEKRTDRHDDRDMGHHPPMERHGMDRDRERRIMQPSPPGDRRRGPMDGGYGHMGDGERKMRGDMRMHSNSRGGPGGRRNDMPDRFHHQDGEFVPRQERFHGSKPWDANPEYVPKGRAYFEHDNRDEMRMPNRGRGMSGPRGYIRGRGMMRGRPFRGAGQTRGYYMGGRGAGRRGGYSPRGFYNAY